MASRAAADPPEVLERFHSHLEVVEIIAHRITRTMGNGIERDDLISAGREGLLDAARRYDPEQGASFVSYASWRIRGSMIDAMRQMSALPRYAHYRLAALQAAAEFAEGDWAEAPVVPAPPAADADGSAERSFDERLESIAVAAAVRLKVNIARPEREEEEAAPGDDPEEALGRAELVWRIQREIDVMVEEKELPADERDILRRFYYEGTSLTEIARDMGLDKSWVSRQHTRAVSRLRKRLQELEFI